MTAPPAAWTSLLAHLELGASNAAVLSVAAELAERLGASVKGVACCQPIQITYGEVQMVGDLLAMQRAEMELEAGEAQSAFRQALAGKAAGLEWRTAMTFLPLHDWIARESGPTDVIVTGPDRGGLPFETTRRTVIGDLAMAAGRPLLIVPPTVAALDLRRCVIAWRDTPEARRALADALPLLALADAISLVEAVEDGDVPAAEARLSDVSRWLRRHGLDARSTALAGEGRPAERLARFADEAQAGLVVAGAYGHSRAGEWVFGGVTRDLLLRSDRCALVSH